MRFFFACSVFLLSPLAQANTDLSSLEADLKSYAHYSDRLTVHLSKIESSANRCWKDQTQGIKLLIVGARFFPNIKDAKESLAANKVMVAKEFDRVLVKAGYRDASEGVSDYQSGTAKLLKFTLSDLEKKLKANQAKVAASDSESKISMVIQCGDPEMIANRRAMETFREAVKDYNSLVSVHQKLRKLLDENEELQKADAAVIDDSSVANAL